MLGLCITARHKAEESGSYLVLGQSNACGIIHTLTCVSLVRWDYLNATLSRDKTSANFPSQTVRCSVISNTVTNARSRFPAIIVIAAMSCMSN